MNHRALALVLLLALAGCEDCNQTPLRPLPPIPPTLQADIFFQGRQTDQMDILLVVDNSCSMEDEQNELANNFEAFIQFMDFVDLDYHLGVITTDSTVNAFEDRGGELVGDPRFITPDTPDAANSFRLAVRVGTGGDGAAERGFWTARRALSAERAETTNAGFYREAADLAIVFVSDEDDQSPNGAIGYLAEWYDMKGGIRDAVQVHGLIGLDLATHEPGPCGAGDPAEGGATAGYRYHEVIEATEGIAAPICTGNFTEMLVEMSQLISGLRARFPLEWIPVEGTVTLTLAIPDTPEYISGGIDIPPEGIDDGMYAWEIQADGNNDRWLRFLATDPAELPPPSSRLVIEYELAD